MRSGGGEKNVVYVREKSWEMPIRNTASCLVFSQFFSCGVYPLCTTQRDNITHVRVAALVCSSAVVHLLTHMQTVAEGTQLIQVGARLMSAQHCWLITQPWFAALCCHFFVVLVTCAEVIHLQQSVSMIRLKCKRSYSSFFGNCNSKVREMHSFYWLNTDVVSSHSPVILSLPLPRCHWH